MTFEQKPPSEDADIAEIVHGILTVQARFAAEQHRPLGRGTHTKGVCVAAQFEVLDISTRVPDPALAARLARGLFARPGAYPAEVRFANAASKVMADTKKDVRALSFSVQVPPDAFGGRDRLDFSMNDAPTFPLNDAHAFAVFMRVAAAKGVLGTLAAIWSLSWRDLRSLAATAVRGARQQRPGLTPYQRLRYWSTVPFLHGLDEAVKYSAIPHPDNPAAHLRPGPNVLRDELVRHVAEDDRMSEFDFAVQFLDTGRMTDVEGEHDAAYWVENASVEWKEAEAPFHVVGRLRLLPRSQKPMEECRAAYIDVTEHSLPECRPIGGINRARWFAEAASRRVRMSQPDSGEARMSEDAVTNRPSWGRRALKAAALLAALGFVAALALMYYPQQQQPPLERADTTVFLDQGWGTGIESEGRQTFYYTAQGAGLKNVRYSWFVNLELPFGRRRFADADHLSRYGFIVDPQTAHNPDGLPVGFTKHFDRQTNEEMLDITCAACHTGQIHVRRGGTTTAIRIDGGQALHAFTDSDIGHFLPTLVSSLTATAVNPVKFNRFARKVLGDQYPRGRWALHREMRGVLGTFLGIMWQEKFRRDLYPTQEGYGRTDALARIANTVFAENLDTKNYGIGNAPVSFPPVWNIWKFDWVQYNASVSQPMARNIGEAMGVGATYALTDTVGRPLPPAERFRSTANIENLHTIEMTLRTLQPPSWPETLLGAVDRAKAERGKALFNQHCVGCHGPHIAPPAIKARNAPLKGPNDPEWLMKTVCVDDVGTDPNAAVNFTKAFVDITWTGMTATDLRAVARRALATWNERQRAYLSGEIARLTGALEDTRRARPAATAGGRSDGTSAPSPSDLQQQLATLQQQLAGLDAAADQALSAIDPSRLSVGAALSYLGTMIREHAYTDLGYSPAQQADRDGFGILDLPQVIAAYKPRPLAGMWATAPFLHNGSVPTIFDLLSPVDERPTTFRVGSRDYDLEKMGIVGEVGGFLFDTSRSGNSNRGHEFGKGYVPWKEGDPPAKGLIGPYLEPEDRYAIIEHLKIRNDDLDGPQEPGIPGYADCSAAAAAVPSTSARR